MFFKNNKSLYNKHLGKSVYILGNGPSINSCDLSFLKDNFVIGMNASTLLEERGGFIHNYYCVSDARFLNHPEKRKFATSYVSSKTHRFIRKDLKSLDDVSLSEQTTYVPHLLRDGFSKNILNGYYYGCTTTMLALQVAYYLGFKDIYLMGMDLRYSPENPRFYKENEVQLEDSFTSIQLMNIAKAGEIFRSESRNLFICSEKSFLRPYLPYFEIS